MTLSKSSRHPLRSISLCASFDDAKASVARRSSLAQKLLINNMAAAGWVAEIRKSLHFGAFADEL